MTIMLSAVLMCATAPLESQQLMTLKVSPAVASEPADLSITVTIEADDRNRALEVSALSDGFVRSSEVQLDGRDAQRVWDFEFRAVPRGNYQVVGTLIGVDGKRAEVTRVAMVISPFAR